MWTTRLGSADGPYAVQTGAICTAHPHAQRCVAIIKTKRCMLFSSTDGVRAGGLQGCECTLDLLAGAARGAEQGAAPADAGAPAPAADAALAAGQRAVIRDLAGRLADLARAHEQLRAERDRAQVHAGYFKLPYS